MRPCFTFLLLCAAAVVLIDAKFYDFRVPDTFYRTSRRALRKTDWALRRKNRGPGGLFSARDRLSLPVIVVDGGEYNEEYDVYPRDTRRALRKSDWVRRPKKAWLGDGATPDDLAVMMRRFVRLVPAVDSSVDDKRGNYWAFPGRSEFKGQIPAMRLG